VAPDEYLRAHRITHRFDNYALFTPLFTQMLFTIGTALKGDVVPGLIHYGFMLLTLGAISSFATRYWERDLGLVAAAFFVTIPTAVLIATWAYVDLAVTFYSFVAVYALFVYLRATGADSERRPTGSMGWLLLAGVFAGASISIKYMGASIVLVLGAILVWWLIRRKLTPRHFLVTSLVLAGLTLAVGGGWYLKNAIVAGNPIYPLVWGGRGWNEISTRWLLTLGEELSLVDLLTVPWTLTVLGTQGTVAYDATFSPLFLLLVPLLLFVPRRAAGLAELGLAAGVGYLGWLASGAVSYGQFVLQGRFLLPIFAPLSLLSAYALDGMRAWDRPGFSLHRVLKMLAALTMVVTLLSQLLFVARFNPVPFLTGYESRQAFQDRMITQQWNQAISYINENLGADDRVMFVWEPRIYGLRVAYQADVVFDNVSQLVYRYGSPERVLLGLCEEGFTHMLVNRYTYHWIVTDYPLTAGERSVWEAFEADYLTDDSAVYTDGTYLTLYALPCNGTTR
jgi:4-amino-4-deoxy-L-arabinose transferase-like glycosyltransferase